MTDKENMFELVIDYDEQFHEQVQSGDPNPLADLTIRAGEYDLTGASGDRFYLDDYVYFNLRKQLDAIESILAGNRNELTFYNIPNDLILDPENATIFVSLVKSSGEPKNDAVPEDGVPITMRAFIEGVVNAAEEFHEKVIEVNPDLEDSEQMRTLRDLIQNAKEKLSDIN
ncbi:hypothetical protein [Halorussus sp. MSC15.2]|uniref:hypothetical protein n=1 Tax=Halorussus sp. MSC15.2 TaxID=2283638 RepID=UPI0013D8BBFC|nr:hypothetical protein [Halorussus sp. MSC15.2]NEU59206.1 hypothetical protein [Halorussus sp. MSC15.2]